MIEVGKFYRHFKGFKIKVIALAKHTEREEELVIYEEEASKAIWARSKAMFLSKVDKEKYPNVEQIYRSLKMDD